MFSVLSERVIWWWHDAIQLIYSKVTSCFMIFPVSNDDTGLTTCLREREVTAYTLNSRTKRVMIKRRNDFMIRHEPNFPWSRTLDAAIQMSSSQPCVYSKLLLCFHLPHDYGVQVSLSSILSVTAYTAPLQLCCFLVTDFLWFIQSSLSFEKDPLFSSQIWCFSK